MADMMTFPDTWEEFEEQYGFTDKKQIYTNGSRLIQSFRVKQWLDHLESEHKQADTPQTETSTNSEILQLSQTEEEILREQCRAFMDVVKQTNCSVTTDGSYEVLDGWQTRKPPKTTDCGWK